MLQVGMNVETASLSSVSLLLTMTDGVVRLALRPVDDPPIRVGAASHGMLRMTPFAVPTHSLPPLAFKAVVKDRQH